VLLSTGVLFFFSMGHVPEINGDDDDDDDIAIKDVIYTLEYT